MKSLIIFDMDGVIVNTHPISGAVMESVLFDILGIKPTPDDFLNFYGLSDQKFYSDIVQRTNTTFFRGNTQ